ncbi:MAG: SpoIIE family protein phosphatase [Actinobacteria bacterium]|nr:SpoIIE family protein phosphatase [Actinomycetota bacterium]
MTGDRLTAAYGYIHASWLLRYGFAVVLSIVGVLASAALTPDNVELFAVLVGVVAVTVWLAGLGPALVALVAGWTFELVDQVTSDTFQGIEVIRWVATGVTALGVVVVSESLRRGREQAAAAASAAEASFRDMAGLQGLSATLLEAFTPSAVAQALVERTPALVGARAAAVGMVDGSDLVIADPRVAGSHHEPGFRMRLAASTPITEAARSGRTIRIDDREAFERDFPEGAALTPYAHRAIAVPLRVAGDTVGALSLLFGDSESAYTEAEAIATLAAGLGGQALERARLYAREQESRQGLDRILRVAPRFHADSVEGAAAAICSEAAATFDADIAILWRLRDRRLELLRTAPPETLASGLDAALEDFPTLSDAVDTHRVSFVPDVQEEARGEGLERVRKLGLRSSFRVPIAIGGGDVELVLIVSWKKIIADPDPAMIALMRRFADQAGFALEQIERRRAQAEAAKRTEETRRLQEVTAALSLASTSTEVSDTCLTHVLEAVEAEAGFVVLSRPEGVIVDFVSSTGYTDDELEHWGTFALDSNVPFARAIASGEPVWALTLAEMAGFSVGRDFDDQGWVSLPLRTAAGVRGALHIAFRRPRELRDEERRWLQAAVSQCAQALERSRLFDAEQRLRQRSDQLQRMTAALSNALTRTDVARVVVDEIGPALGASATALGIVLEDRSLVQLLASVGYADESVESRQEVSLDEPTPGNRAVKRRVSAFYESLEDVRVTFPDVSAVMELAEHESFLYVPLVAGRRANGLLVMSWAEHYSLSTEDRRFVEALAGQAAQALDRASAYESEQSIAETLQRSVLPVSLPRVEGMQLAARYMPGTAGVAVGGDWFDAIRLQDGQLGLVVGDVVGKGVQAAATMGQLRNGLRAFSLDRMKPSSTLTRLNRLAEEVMETAFATVAYVVIDAEAGLCRYTSAGHPPPLVAFPDGRVEFMEGGRGLPLGAGANTRYTQEILDLPVGTTLVLYTDGLVERRGESIDEGLARLRLAVSEGPLEPEQLVEHLLQRLVGSGERGDDVALLAVRLLAVAPRPLHLQLPSETRSLDLVRDAMRTWLAGAPLSGSDSHDVVLAVWEACANSIEHAVAPRENTLRVQADLSESLLRISVEDTGAWLPPTERTDRGFGLRLMRAAMTSIEITPASTGTRVTLEKSLAGAAEPAT